MNILAIDTTTKKAIVGIKKDDEIVLKSINNEITHSEKLLPLIDDILNETNTKLTDVDLLACVVGPGSFTGVRIGIATIKAIAKVIKKEIIGVTSLELLALEALKHDNMNYVLALMDAKNDRAYYELFENKDSLFSTTFAGNDYIQNIIENIKTKNINNLLIVTDNSQINEKLNSCNAKVVTVDESLSNIFDESLKSNIYNYLTLDAKYYRKSEAERTKDGE